MENKIDRKESRILEVSLTRQQLKNIPGITYSQPVSKTAGIVKLEMDILKPNRSDEKFPAVLFVTGGAFINSKKGSYLQQRVQIAEHGYVVASIEYRTIPAGVFRDTIEDVKSALRFLRANADKFDIDKERIAVMGDSAGGYLATMAGLTNDTGEFDKGDYLSESSDVKAVVNIYGVSDMTKIGEGFSEEIQEAYNSEGAPAALWVNGLSLFQKSGTVKDNPETEKESNPLNYVTESAPPFLIMHGDEDTMVSPRQTEILHEALVEKGADSVRYIVRGAEHSGKYWVQPEVMKVVIDFLDKNV